MLNFRATSRNGFSLEALPWCACLLWGMRRFVIRYSVEFFVLFTGLLLTFYIEDLNQHRHKVELKDQSLSRLIKNVEDDVTDLSINLFKIQSAID